MYIIPCTMFVGCLRVIVTAGRSARMRLGHINLYHCTRYYYYVWTRAIMESRVERSRDEDLLRRAGHRGGVAGGNVWRVCCATAVYNAS